MLSILTEVVFIGALVALGAAAWRDRRNRARVLGLPRWVVHAALILVTFLILMEEMSWGQHWGGWTAGPMFAGNVQNETGSRRSIIRRRFCCSSSCRPPGRRMSQPGCDRSRHSFRRGCLRLRRCHWPGCSMRNGTSCPTSCGFSWAS